MATQYALEQYQYPKDAQPAERALLQEVHSAKCAYNDNPTQELKIAWLRAKIRCFDFQTRLGLGTTETVHPSEREEAGVK